MSLWSNIGNAITSAFSGGAFQPFRSSPPPPQPQQPAPQPAPQQQQPQFNLGQLTQNINQSAGFYPSIDEQIQQHQNNTQQGNPFLGSLQSLTQGLQHLGEGGYNLAIKPAVQVAQEGFNTLAGTGAGLAGLTDASVAALTHNPTAEQNAIANTRAALEHFMGKNKVFITPQEAASGQVIKPVLRTAGAVAPYFASGAASPEASALAKLLTPAGVFGGANALGTTLQEAGQGHINPSDVLKSGAMGAAQGAVGGALGLAGEAATKAPETIANANESFNQHLDRMTIPREGGYLGEYPDLSGEVDPNTLSKMATNSLENVPTGEKPGSVDFNRGMIDNGKADPINVRRLDDGTLHIEDGRHRLEAAKQLGMDKYPIKDVTSEYAQPRDAIGRYAERGGIDVNPKEDPIAKALGLTSEDTQKAAQLSHDVLAGNDQALANNISAQGLAIDDRIPENGPKTAAATQEAIDSMNANPLKLEDLPSNLTSPKDAITTGMLPARQFHAQLISLVKNAQDVVGDDPVLARAWRQALEHPEQTDAIASQFFSGNEGAFKDLVDQGQHVYNLDHASQGVAGNPRPFTTNYTDHPWDLSTPEAQQVYANAVDRLSKGQHAMTRVFPTIEEGEAAGLKLNDQSLSKQISQWGAYEESSIQNHGLLSQLQKIDPSVSVVRKADGGVTWAAADPKVQKALAGLQPYTVSTPGRVYDTANRIGKEATLGGGFFHDMMTSLRYSEQRVSQAVMHPSTIPGMFKNAFEGRHAYASPQEFQGFMDNWNGRGGDALDAAAQFKNEPLSSDFSSSFNPIASATNRKINVYKRLTLEAQLQKYGITPENFDVNDAGQRKIVSDLGAQTNNWYGGIDNKIMGTPVWAQKGARRVLLATDFTQGKVNTLVNVFTRGAGGSLARQQLTSNVLGTAIIAEALNKAVNGNFTNPLEAVLAPQIHTNMTDSKGRKLTVHLPSTPVTDVQNLIKDPAHAATSRLAFVPSVGIQGKTGRDFYGNQIVNPYQNPNPSYAENLAGALKTRITIPGVQAQKFLSGHQSLGVSALNTAGLRTNLDQTDPKVQAQNAYYGALAKNTAPLNPVDRSAVTSYVSRAKTPDGQTITLNQQQERQNAGTLFTNDNARTAVQNIETSQPKHDPMWDLPSDKLKTFINFQSMIKDSADQLALKKNNPWLNDVEAARGAFFQGIQKSGNSAQDPNYVKYPLNPQESQLMSQASKITDSTQKEAFYQSHPELVGINQKYGQYVNDVRKLEGAAPIPTTPPADQATQAFMNEYLSSSKPARTALRLANPTGYAGMQNYLTQASLHSVLREASIDQAGGGNPASDQKLLKSLFSLGQYDIVKNQDGTYALGSSYGLKGGVAGTSSAKRSSSGGGRTYIRAAQLRQPRAPRIFAKRPKQQKFQAPILKFAKPVKGLNLPSSRTPTPGVRKAAAKAGKK